MNESLYFDGQKVDIRANQITRKIAIADIGDIESRKSTFSYTFKIPKTANNEKILNMLGVTGNQSRKPYELISANYIVDGISIIKNGYAIIKKTGQYFEANLIDGIKGLSVALAGKKLVDLPLEDLNHILTAINYVNSFNNSEGFIYCLADYGLGASASVKVEKEAPCIYVHTLFRRIFEANGFRLEGNFFTNNTDYLTEVLAPSQGYEITEEELIITDKGEAHTNQLTNYIESLEYSRIEDRFTIIDDSLTDITISGGNMIIGVNAVYSFEFLINYTLLFNTEMFIDVRVNGVSKANFNCPEPDSPKTKTAVLRLEAGDEISIYAVCSSGLNSGVYVTNYFVDLEIDVETQEGGQLIEPSFYIADMLQIDFIKDIINRYGLILQPTGGNQFEFTQLETVLQDRDNAEDWTAKVSGINSESYVSGYAQTNKAKYKYPDSIKIPNNDGEILTENETAELEKTLFESKFTIPEKAYFVNAIQMYYAKIWESVGGVIELKEIDPIVFRIKRYNTEINAKLFDETTGIDVSENVPILSLENMSMQYFLNTYYPSFQKLINNYCLTQFKMNLSIVDIVNIDFLKLKYLKQTQRFYYLNSTTYKAGKVSTVNMIEIQQF